MIRKTIDSYQCRIISPSSNAVRNVRAAESEDNSDRQQQRSINSNDQNSGNNPLNQQQQVNENHRNRNSTPQVKPKSEVNLPSSHHKPPKRQNQQQQQQSMNSNNRLNNFEPQFVQFNSANSAFTYNNFPYQYQQPIYPNVEMNTGIPQSSPWNNMFPYQYQQEQNPMFYYNGSNNSGNQKRRNKKK